MEHSAPKTGTLETLRVGRLLWVGALAAVLSASANALVPAIAPSATARIRGSGFVRRGFVRRRGLFERR